MNIGYALKTIRTTRGLTLMQASLDAGVAVSTLSKIERGKLSPTLNVLAKISHGLGLSVADLLAPSHNATKPIGWRSVIRRSDQQDHSESAPNYCSDIPIRSLSTFILSASDSASDVFMNATMDYLEVFLYVISGKMTVFTSTYSPSLLDRGDAIYIDRSILVDICTHPECGSEILVACAGRNTHLPHAPKPSVNLEFRPTGAV